MHRAKGWLLQQRLILLEVSPEDKHPLAVRSRSQLLHAAHLLKPLWTSAFRDDDVDLEPVADLFKEKGGVMSALVQ